MSSHQFERLISDLVARDGLDVAQGHGDPHDGGLDVIAITPGGDKPAIQCKHTAKETPVGIAAVRELNGIAGPVHHTDITTAPMSGILTVAVRPGGRPHGPRSV
ncbi:restriction endonuclease [Streptomyces kanamyceticus]